MENQFSAAASLLGYVYQFRFALRLALQRYQVGLDWSVRLESADDVEESNDETGNVAYSLKHHTTPVSLTNASPDFWKSIRVWCEGIEKGRIEVANASLVLVTTSTVPVDSAPGLLRAGEGRDELKALALMQETAAETKNETNKLAFEAFLGLDDDGRRSLVDAITVVGSSPDITQIESDIRSMCALAFGHPHLEDAVERVEGWWMRTCLEQLTGRREAIDGLVVAEKLRDLRTQFGPDGLPIDDDILNLQVDEPTEASSAFVQQLLLIDVGSSRLATAIRDYRRAFVQRSRWTRQGHLVPGELDVYEERLRDEWRRCYDEMIEELGSEEAEAEKVKQARLLYRWSQDVELQIRPKCDEPFVRRGTFHLLADAMSVGWHPEFEIRLLHLLEAEGTAS